MTSNLGNGQSKYTMGGNGIFMPGEALSEEKKKLALEELGKKQKELQDAKEAQYQAIIKESQEAKTKAKDLEIMPLGGQILVKLYDKNPYDTVDITDNGLIVPSFDGVIFDKESGQERSLAKVTEIGHVIEVGPDVKYIKEGDDIMFRSGGQTPVPFLKQGFWTVHQNNVLVTINLKLQERFSAIKNE